MDQLCYAYVNIDGVKNYVSIDNQTIRLGKKDEKRYQGEWIEILKRLNFNVDNVYYENMLNFAGPDWDMFTLQLNSIEIYENMLNVLYREEIDGHKNAITGILHDSFLGQIKVYYTKRSPENLKIYSPNEFKRLLGM